MAAPTPSRPDMPGYGIAPPGGGEGLLPWSWAEERLTASHGYWLASTRHDGRPHAAPVWAIWMDGAVWFSTGVRSAKARNLAADPRCTITTESTIEAVIVDGTAARVDPHPAAVITAYEAKYSMGFPPGEPLYRVEPARAFAFIDEGERFTATATRWTFS
jgi:hypothetical protein